MSIQVKICGLQDSETVDACVFGGARFIGFVFYAKSRRAIPPEKARALTERIPSYVLTTGLFVDPTDDEIDAVFLQTPLRSIQLHGTETPERVAEIKQKTRLPIIKAVGIIAPEDIAFARSYQQVCDYLLLDAKPPPCAVPGGNGVAFDWNLLKGVSFSTPWLLAGGLNETNLAQAISVTGARMLDVSSGVENAAGQKSPEKILSFLAHARLPHL